MKDGLLTDHSHTVKLTYEIHLYVIAEIVLVSYPAKSAVKFKVCGLCELTVGSTSTEPESELKPPSRV